MLLSSPTMCSRTPHWLMVIWMQTTSSTPPYLNNFNKENGTDLVSAFDMHYEPFGIYAGKTASIEELKDGASIAIPNDGSNETRALLLLQDAGLIKLRTALTRPPTLPSWISPRTREPGHSGDRCRAAAAFSGRR